MHNDTLRDTPCTCAKVRRTARRLTQAYDRALQPLGLRLTQYSVLANLEQAGPLSVTDLAALLAMERTTLTRNLGPLSQAGWITVGPGPDRRSRTVALTEAGRAVVQRAQPLWREAERSLRRALGREHTAALHRLLDAAYISLAT